MPYVKIDVEQTAPDRYLLEAEVSFPVCKHITKIFPTMREAMDAGWEFYALHVLPKEPTLEPDVRAALVAEAEGLGIDIDGRWGLSRLRQAIAEHRGMTALESHA